MSTRFSKVIAFSSFSLLLLHHSQSLALCRASGTTTNQVSANPGPSYWTDGCAWISFNGKNGADGSNWVWHFANVDKDEVTYCNTGAQYCTQTKSFSHTSIYLTNYTESLLFSVASLGGLSPFQISQGFEQSDTTTWSYTVQVGPSHFVYPYTAVAEKVVKTGQLHGYWRTEGAHQSPSGRGPSIWSQTWWWSNAVFGSWSGVVTDPRTVSGYCILKRLMPDDQYQVGPHMPADCAPPPMIYGTNYFSPN